MAAVIEQAVGPYLCGRQIPGDMHGNSLQAQLLCSLETCVAGNDHALAVHYDRLAKREFLDRRSNLVDCFRAQLSCVARVRNRFIDRPVFDIHPKTPLLNSRFTRNQTLVWKVSGSALSAVRQNWPLYIYTLRWVL